MTPAPALPPGTRVGVVRLSVADLARSAAFYADRVGLVALEHDGAQLTLGAGDRPLLVLEEEPGASPACDRAGLFHFALLVPERADLARWLAHAIRDRVVLSGASDHYVSEAIYLDDPDRHGIEIYADRPRAVWEGQVAGRMTVEPLDIDGLLGSLDGAPPQAGFDGLPAQTRMGHVHLRVSDVPASVAFYRDLLGFDLVAQLGSQAAFFAADGYHHHVGANTWGSRGAPLAEPGSARLLEATVLLPDQASLDGLTERLSSAGQLTAPSDGGVVVHDPSGIALVLALSADG